jgi:nucleoside-diphosphate-sugar epimerase
MKIGISGASGQLGSATVKLLRARFPGAQLVGISRTPEKVSALGVEARFGDFDKPQPERAIERPAESGPPHAKPWPSPGRWYCRISGSA